MWLARTDIFEPFEVSEIFKTARSAPSAEVPEFIPTITGDFFLSTSCNDMFPIMSVYNRHFQLKFYAHHPVQGVVESLLGNFTLATGLHQGVVSFLGRLKILAEQQNIMPGLDKYPRYDDRNLPK